MNSGEQEKSVVKGSFTPGPAWRAAEAAGVDMSLLELNLSKTPLERMRAHDRALAQALQLREALLDLLQDKAIREQKGDPQ